MSHFLSGQAEGEEVVNGQEVENGPVAQPPWPRRLPCTPSRQGQIPKISSWYHGMGVLEDYADAHALLAAEAHDFVMVAWQSNSMEQ